MTRAAETLPDDVDALRALFVAERTALETERAAHTKTATERDRLAELNAKLEAIVAEIRRAQGSR